MNESIFRVEIRRTIRDVIQTSESDGVPYDDVIGVASQQQGVTAEAVTKELESLERAGFVYVVGDDKRVKLP